MDGLEHTVNTDIETNETNEENEKKDTSLQISDAIERLLANPELLSTVAAAIGAKSPTDKKDEPNVPVTNIETKAENNAQEEAISAEATSDISKKLPEIMATVAPVIASLSGKGGGVGKLPDDDRTRLLYALRPYVNPHRREAIEAIVQLARISEIIKNVK